MPSRVSSSQAATSTPVGSGLVCTLLPASQMVSTAKTCRSVSHALTNGPQAAIVLPPPGRRRAGVRSRAAVDADTAVRP